MSDGDGPKVCRYCNKICKSGRGLTQHINNSVRCKNQNHFYLQGQEAGYRTACEFMETTAIQQDEQRTNMMAVADYLVHKHWQESRGKQVAEVSDDTDQDEQEEDFGPPPDDDDEEEEEEEEEELDRDQWILADFNQYVDYANSNFLEFTQDEVIAIECMYKLRNSSCPLYMYDSMMEWHFHATGQLEQHESIGRSARNFISSSVLFNKLFTRYNLKNKMNKVVQITLPSSRAKATIVKNDLNAMFQSLLTDPRIVDDNYLFPNGDPFAEFAFLRRKG